MRTPLHTISDQVVSKFLEECEIAGDIDGLAASFVKEYGTSSQVKLTYHVAMALVVW